MLKLFWTLSNMLFSYDGTLYHLKTVITLKLVISELSTPIFFVIIFHISGTL